MDEFAYTPPVTVLPPNYTLTDIPEGVILKAAEGDIGLLFRTQSEAFTYSWYHRAEDMYRMFHELKIISDKMKDDFEALNRLDRRKHHE